MIARGVSERCDSPHLVLRSEGRRLLGMIPTGSTRIGQDEEVVLGSPTLLLERNRLQRTLLVPSREREDLRVIDVAGRCIMGSRP